MQVKLKTFEEIEKILSRGMKVVQCHGVFDLLHPGHIRHFKQAKKYGDVLVVTVTPDKFVNKGPGRPVFNEKLRLESLASLACVDYVILNDSPDAVSAILRLKPTVYVKGKEYEDASKDVTGKILDEKKAVEDVGGTLLYTDDIVFSSSSLINKYIDPYSPEVEIFLKKFKKKYSLEQILEKIEALNNLRVLVVGDAIIDEYQYVEPMGLSGKGLHMVVSCLHAETFLGGTLAIANNAAQFSNNVEILSSVGENFYLLQNMLASKVKTHFLPQDMPTLIKKRYVMQDGQTLTKFFETYSSNKLLLSKESTDKAVDFLQKCSKDFDLILLADFDNGFINYEVVKSIDNVDAFLAVNTQVNSGNRGFNVITKYNHADYISLNEPELRLAMHDRYTSPDNLMVDIADVMQCPNMAVTRGVNGVLCFSAAKNNSFTIPAFTTHAVDRIGAGDSFLAISALCMAKGYDLELAAFLGSIAAAMSIQFVGNKEVINKAQLCKFLTRLLK
jgi:rfaE bifunctional protein nucleotidyltransferase chain/domain